MLKSSIKIVISCPTTLLPHIVNISITIESWPTFLCHLQPYNSVTSNNMSIILLHYRPLSRFNDQASVVWMCAEYRHVHMASLDERSTFARALNKLHVERKYAIYVLEGP